MPATPTEIGKQQKNLKLKPSMVSMPTYTALGQMPVPNAWEQLKIPIPYCTQWAAEHIHLPVLHRMTFHAMPKSQFQSNQMVNVDFWLVVLTILKNISQWEGLSHISWKKKMFQTTSQICICIIHLFLLPGLPNNGTPTIIPSTSQWSQRWSLRTVGHAASAKKEAFHRVVSACPTCCSARVLWRKLLEMEMLFSSMKAQRCRDLKKWNVVPISHKLIGTDWITQRWPARRECKESGAFFW